MQEDNLIYQCDDSVGVGWGVGGACVCVGGGVVLWTKSVT